MKKLRDNKKTHEKYSNIFILYAKLNNLSSQIFNKFTIVFPTWR